MYKYQPRIPDNRSEPLRGRTLCTSIALEKSLSNRAEDDPELDALIREKDPERPLSGRTAHPPEPLWWIVVHT